MDVALRPGRCGSGYHVQRSTSNAISFLAPGLVHQFGNLLLTIQGQALALAPHAVDRGREAILTATDRGGATLRLLRYLLGEPGGGVHDAAGLCEQFAEVARVPVREAGYVLDWRPPHQTKAMPVDAGELIPLLTEGLRGLVLAIPAGAVGRVVLGCGTVDGMLCLRLQFQPAAGSLPFPLASEAAALAVAAAQRQHGWQGRCLPTPLGLELQLPLADPTTEA
jgi:hypothetical protein